MPKRKHEKGAGKKQERTPPKGNVTKSGDYHRKMDSTKDPRVTDDHVFFYRSWPSQWHISPMTINNVQYNCCEQYMMAEKARLFRDEETRKHILNCSAPFAHKKFGQMVRNFKEKKWNQNKRRIVYEGNYAKFSQNLKLQQQLLSFGDRTFVEATTKDKIWGIGIDVWDTTADHPHNWRGQNLLGAAITEVRNTLLREQQEHYGLQQADHVDEKEQSHTVNNQSNSDQQRVCTRYIP